MFKRCARCKEQKPLDDFHRNQHRVDGRAHTCRVCRSAATQRLEARKRAERPAPAPETKTCSVCGETKPLNRFMRGPRYQLGVSRQCKACRCEWQRKHDAELAVRAKITVPSKVCVRCKEEKPIAQFTKNLRYKDGYGTRCKQCRKEAETRPYGSVERRTKDFDNYLWSLYRLTSNDFEALLEQQQGKCAVCGEVMSKPRVDHCHQSGRVRGLVCNTCNTGLGHIERRGFVEKALAYLEKQK